MGVTGGVVVGDVEGLSEIELRELLSLKKSISELSVKETKKTRLTQRDYNILEFIQDQKFATLEALYFRFFDARKDASEELPKQFFTTRQRLLVLRQVGLLSSKHSMYSPQQVYVLTPKGYQVLSQERPSRAFQGVTYDLDSIHFRHDEKVTLCRVAIEKTGKAIRWLSEQRLRSVGFEVESFEKKMPKSAIPDGIFIAPKGKRVAFEIECSPRKKERFKAKARFYEELMQDSQPLIEHVIWVAVDKRIYADLQESIPVGSKLFSVEPFSYFLGKLSTSAQKAEVNNG